MLGCIVVHVWQTRNAKLASRWAAAGLPLAAEHFQRSAAGKSAKLPCSSGGLLRAISTVVTRMLRTNATVRQKALDSLYAGHEKRRRERQHSFIKKIVFSDVPIFVSFCRSLFSRVSWTREGNFESPLRCSAPVRLSFSRSFQWCDSRGLSMSC